MAALEQVWQRWAGESLVLVVAGHQRHVVTVAAQAVYHSGEDVGQFRGDQQDPLGVLFGRCDLQQRDDLAGVGQGVGGQRQVG